MTSVFECEKEFIWMAEKQKQFQIVSNINSSVSAINGKNENLCNNILKLTTGTLELIACKKLICILEHWQSDGVFNHPKDNDDLWPPNTLLTRGIFSLFHIT